MKCPVCQTMLSPSFYAGQTIDLCKQCGGVWFDSEELSPVVKTVAEQENISHLSVKETLNRAAPKPLYVEQDKLCPRCNISTSLFNYSYDSNIFLNRCPSCRGIWADRGELRQLARYSKGNPKVEALAIALVKHHGHKKSRVHQFLTSRLLSGGVALFYFFIAAGFGGAEEAIKTLLFLILPLACIWFSDAMGNYTGNLIFPRPPITEKSPGIMVAFMGWVLLLFPVVIGVVLVIK